MMRNIADEDTSDHLMELVHQIQFCEDTTETDISQWIRDDIECDLTGLEIINITTEKPNDSEDDDQNSIQEKCITPDKGFKRLSHQR